MQQKLSQLLLSVVPDQSNTIDSLHTLTRRLNPLRSYNKCNRWCDSANDIFMTSKLCLANGPRAAANKQKYIFLSCRNFVLLLLSSPLNCLYRFIFRAKAAAAVKLLQVCGDNQRLANTQSWVVHSCTTNKLQPNSVRFLSPRQRASS